MDLSIVVPLYDEVESLPELTEWIERVATGGNYDYELIYIDDGSRDGSWRFIEEVAGKNDRIKGIKFKRNYGKSAALHVGFQAAGGRVVITMDADLQDSPDEIPELYRMITEEGYDMVSGWKKKRFDPFSKRVPSKFFNWISRKMSGLDIHDFNCGLKAYRLELVKSIEIYGEIHRYIPVIAKWAGFRKIGEKPVQHQRRKYGQTKFGFERFINGFLDMLVVSFVGRFGKRPMHLFGLLGTLSFFGGGVVTIMIISQKLYKLSLGLPVREITEQPSFYLAMLAIIIGVQLFLAGFLAEMIARNSPDRDKYLIEKTTS